MAPDDRSSGGGTVGSFDFNSNAGVLRVLAAIRTSTLSPTERNELRDMVFLYSNGGHDAGVRSLIEQRLTAHGIIPVAGTGVTPMSAEPAPQAAGFAGSRPAPTFRAPAPVPAPAVAVPVAAPAPAPIVPPPVVPPQVVVVPVPTPVAVAPVAPIVPPVAVPTQIAPAPAPIAPVAVPAPAPLPVPPPAPYVDPANARLERIKKIKSDINDRVGNPVNLVDIDNTLGREYMGALLDAMKLLSTASEAESGAAMNRLETVYVQVMNRLQSPGAPAAPITPIAPTVPVSVPVQATVPVSVPPVVRTIPVQSQEFVAPPAERIAPVSAPLPSAVPPPVMPAPLNLEPKQTEQEIKAAEAAWGNSSEPAVASVPAAPAVPAPVVPIGASGVIPLMSVAATATPLRTPADLPSADSLQASSVSGDPRYTKEVDDGLNQLLSEWTLFKKSGLFGTGPHGKDHPLFLKIANLQIPIILSGRFEGSTQEIKQSITDYMNGWRYEQGIIYDQGETFEQYLRRVIRHIIDLQNKRRAS